MPYNFQNTLKESGPDACLVNRNFASPVGFRVIIEGREFTDVEYSIQQIFLPDITCNPTVLGTPTREISFPGDRIEYSDLSFTFLVDETYNNYRQVHDWILSNALIDNPQQRKSRDIVLMPFTSHNNVSAAFRFTDAFPTNLTSLEYDTTASEVSYLTASVTFRYSYYKFE